MVQQLMKQSQAVSNRIFIWIIYCPVCFYKALEHDIHGNFWPVSYYFKDGQLLRISPCLLQTKHFNKFIFWKAFVFSESFHMKEPGNGTHCAVERTGRTQLWTHLEQLYLNTFYYFNKATTSKERTLKEIWRRYIRLKHTSTYDTIYHKWGRQGCVSNVRMLLWAVTVRPFSWGPSQHFTWLDST